MININEFIRKKHFDISADYVDLDLPSGTKWAKYNIGANNPEESGDFFALGETSTKTAYNDDTYQFEYDKKSDKISLDDDAAYVNSSNLFRLPTKEEVKELVEYTTSENTCISGIRCKKFTSKKDKSKYIVFPCAGYYYDDKKLEKNQSCYIWCNHVFTSGNGKMMGYYMYFFNRSKPEFSACTTELGFNVRGVLV